MNRPTVADQHWYSITNLGQNAAEIWVYAEIGGWGITADGLVSELAALNVAEIVVHLNSPGGDVFDGIAIMNALRDHPANVTVKVDALAASIASIIAQAGNKIIMGRNSMMMIHNASGFAMGESKDLRKMADLLEATTDNLADVYTERAGGKKKEWLAAMDAETWYSAEEAVAAGLADEVAPLPTEREAHQQAARFDLSNYAHAPKIEDPADGGAVPGTGPVVGETGCTLVIPSAVPQPDPATEPLAWDVDLFKRSVTAALPTKATWDPDVFRTAVSMAVTDAPSVPITPVPETPGPAFNPDVFTLAMREARRRA